MATEVERLGLGQQRRQGHTRDPALLGPLATKPHRRLARSRHARLPVERVRRGGERGPAGVLLAGGPECPAEHDGTLDVGQLAR
ncbi:hypothetical protein WME94_19915 [Sorangium sp. So ce429]